MADRRALEWNKMFEGPAVYEISDLFLRACHGPSYITEFIVKLEFMYKQIKNRFPEPSVCMHLSVLAL